jgi:hypothetical protein
MNRLKDTSLAEIIRAHKLARAAHDERHMKFIEDTLTDINYHTIRDLMHDGEYIKAAEQHRTAGEKD